MEGVSKEWYEQNYGRVFNFFAGPSTLPVSVLEEARDQLLNWKGSGKSIIEMSHRSKDFEEVLFETATLLRTLMGIPKNYHLLFLQGGASLQFTMIPLNFLKKNQTADYILTGTWGEKALESAKHIGKTHCVYSSKSFFYDRIPSFDDLSFSDNAAYVHITSSETIQGVDYLHDPEIKLPLVADVSSNILARPIDVSRYALLYAGAQKNMGPAGVTVVIVQDEFLQKAECLHPMLSYKNQVNYHSLYNTPPCWNIYMCGLVYQWCLEEGGIEAIHRRNKEKSDLIYKTIDQSEGFYKPHAQNKFRSLTNITFTLKDNNLTQTFLEQAAAKGLEGLGGHESVGGCRASVYNAFPIEGCMVLVDFMKEFANKYTK